MRCLISLYVIFAASIYADDAFDFSLRKQTAAAKCCSLHFFCFIYFFIIIIEGKIKAVISLCDKVMSEPLLPSLLR